MLIKKYALALSERGYSIFPVYGKNRPVCKWSAYQKSKADLHQIESWFTQHPGANCAIVTGFECNGFFLIVIDADTQSAIDYCLENLPLTHWQTVTSRGKHFFYKIKKAVPSFSNKTRKDLTLDDTRRFLDVRCQGGYVIAPYSIHPETGNIYKGLPENQLLPSIDELPEINIDSISKIKDIKNPVLVSAPVLNVSPSVQKIQTSTGTIYDTYYKICASLHISPSPDSQIKTLAPCHDDQHQSFSITVKNGNILMKCFAGCSIETICNSLGVKVSDLFTEQKTIQSVSPQEPINHYEESILTFPKHLLTPPGFVGELAQYLCSIAIKPQPILAIGASLTLCGSLLGRKVRTSTNLRTNFYCIALAGTGSGKDFLRRGLKEIVSDAGLTKHYLGGEEIASDSALQRVVFENPSCLLLLDEFGRMFESMSNAKQSPHLSGIITMLMKFRTSANGLYLGKEYANRGGQQGRLDIDQPNLCVFATSTIDQFLGKISSSDMIDGFLNRCLLFFSEDHNPPKQKITLVPTPNWIIERVHALHALPFNSNNSHHGNLAFAQVCPKIIPHTQEAEIYLEEAEKFFASQDRPIFWTRAVATAMELSLIIAAADLRDEIDAEITKYAIELVYFNILTTIRYVDSYLADSRFHSLVQRVKRIIRESKKKGISKSELYRKTQFLTKREREEVLELLIESSEILLQEEKLSRKTSHKYFAI